MMICFILYHFIYKLFINLIYHLNKLYNIIYMSKRIDASVWGNSAWHLLHTID